MKQKHNGQGMGNKVQKITIVFLVITISLLVGCDLKLKQAIEAYKGTGQINYLKGPLLGTSGVAIKMPSLDLVEPFEVEYQLTGIPKGNRYVVYLVIPEPCPIDKILQGSFELQIYQDNILVNKIIAPTLEKMTNRVGGGENRFYFYEKGQFDVNEVGATWSIKVKSANKKLSASVNAFILISTGGYK